MFRCRQVVEPDPARPDRPTTSPSPRRPHLRSDALMDVDVGGQVMPNVEPDHGVTEPRQIAGQGSRPRPAASSPASRDSQIVIAACT